jgi:uncharacterized phage protein gp47/JayE
MYPEWLDETEDEILQRMLSNVPDEWDKREGSFIYDVLKPSAIERKLQNDRTKELLDLHYVKTSTGLILDRLIESRTPLKREEARFAKGKVQIIGLPGTFIPKGTMYMGILTSEYEQFIEFEQIQDATIGADGVVVVDVEAMQAGELGNIPAGSIQLAEPIVGVADVDNPENFYDGADEESDDDYRQRYFTYMQNSGNDGNIAQYTQWLTQMEGVGGFHIIPNWNGPNTVKVVIIDRNKMPASPELVTATQQYLDPIPGQGYGQAPIGHFVTVESAEPFNLDIDTTLELDTGVILANIQPQIEQAIEEYRKAIAFKEMLIRISRIQNIIVDTPGVLDYTNLTINGGTGNITIPENCVPIIHSIILR